mgnify:FL=1
MNYFKHFDGLALSILERMQVAGDLPDSIDFARVSAGSPRDATHGDVALNAAMVLAKQAGMKPRDLATRIAVNLAQHADIESAEVAGPGFINLRAAASFWPARLAEILAAGRNYGASDIGAGRTTNVEYVSANPTGPLHVGHGRGAVFGDALAALLEKAGHTVIREYYVNDAGSQVDTLAQSALLRMREAQGENIGEIPDGLYPGNYLKAVGIALAKLPESEQTPVGARTVAVEMMMESIREDLAAAGIKQDLFSSERALVEAGRVEKAVADLEAKGLVYVGVLEPPKGKLPDDWEARPQTLFRASEFGDDTDRPLKKSDGSWTYFATDIAYHFDKYERGSETLINVWGADHGGYVKRVAAAMQALTGKKDTLDVKLCQLVKLMRDGKPAIMSKRSGTFVTLREVIDEVGADVVRFMMLTRKNDAPLEFDLARALEQSRDNPVFYVQYAHARCRSVLRHAEEAGADISVAGLAAANLALLIDPEETRLVKQLASWPRMVEQAAEAHEPHRVAFFLQETAAAFHQLWNKGREDTTLRFIQEDALELTKSRLALVSAVTTVISSGLAVIGVKAAEEM